MITKRFIFCILALASTSFTLELSAQNKYQVTVDDMLRRYPESRVVDVYKSLFQDKFGPGHLVSDTVSAREYLHKEVENMGATMLPYYEPAGAGDNYYRVSLAVIKDGLVSEDVFFSAFLESAQKAVLPSVENWRDEWRGILPYIPQSIDGYDKDVARIDSLLATGNYAMHHSEQFNEAYRPHYRLIQKDIFNKRLLPAISVGKTGRGTSRNDAETRNVMLNASSANSPREIQIGLPGTAGGTEIFEDGVLTGYYFWPLMQSMHWRNGTSYRKIGMLNLSESALKSGNVGYSVDSRSRLGGDKFEGLVSYNTNQFGLQRFQINANGPIAKGWYYNADIFQNFDPGSAPLKFIDNDRMEIYRAGVTKRFAQKGEISFLYKFARNKGMSDNQGPFYYVGDGSVREYPGFNLGRSVYLPADGRMEYQDIVTGDTISTYYTDRATTIAQEFVVVGNYTFKNGMKLDANLKYDHSNSNYLYNHMAGIDNVSTIEGYTLADGTPYEGEVQNRTMMYWKGRTTDFMATAELSWNRGNHHWRLGLNEWRNHASLMLFNSFFAHEVKASPERLYKAGRAFWDFNTGSEYYDGNENKLAVYFSDNWQPIQRLNLSYGVRLEYYKIWVNSLMNASENDTNNDRVSGFSMKTPGVSITKFKHNWINPIGSVRASYDIGFGLGVNAEYLYNRQRPRLEDFAGSATAQLAPVDVNLIVGGLYYNSKWVTLISNVSYITKSNYKTRAIFTKSINGVSETQRKAVMYDIGTIGWTTDAIVTPFKGFSLHLLTTFQKPRYKDYSTDLQFSDSSVQHVDFSDKIVSGISQTLFEIDPSYSYKKWRVWLSARYFGKTYANKLNTIYFKGRWETFGGVAYTVNKHLKLDVNVVNILNQKGARGSINAADLIEDPSAFRNYLMSGSYIRPFTVEFSVNLTI